MYRVDAIRRRLTRAKMKHIRKTTEKFEWVMSWLLLLLYRNSSPFVVSFPLPIANASLILFTYQYSLPTGRLSVSCAMFLFLLQNRFVHISVPRVTDDDRFTVELFNVKLFIIFVEIG